MCDRLTRLMRIAYDGSWAELSRRLGYANETGIQAIKEGRAFPDVQRLSLLHEWPIEGNYVPSLTWIISGVGPAVLKYQNDQIIHTLDLKGLAEIRALTFQITRR